MKSIRAKILSLILFTVITTALAILLVAIVCINYLNRKDSNQLLTEIGQKNASEINGTLESMEHVGWYYVPQEMGEATWVGPYMNRNLGSGMISYVAPIYIDQAFTAIVGMDIDIHVLRDRVKKITAYETGTALLFDREGNLVYHHEYPNGRDRAEFSSADTIVFAAMQQTNTFLRPLDDLTHAAEQLSEGNMDISLYYKGEDEIGTLSRTFEMMSGSLKSYFDHFHGLAYTDNLTGLNNKTAFSMVVDVIDSEIQMGRASFSVIVMDVNNLKTINDSLGHDIGDTLLQHVAKIMRRSIIGYPLYRVGGDEFAAIVNNVNPQDLIERLQSNTAKQSREDEATFGVSYQIAAGAATYQKGEDQSFNEVFHRADQLMYENKRMLKGTGDE